VSINLASFFTIKESWSYEKRIIYGDFFVAFEKRKKRKITLLNIKTFCKASSPPPLTDPLPQQDSETKLKFFCDSGRKKSNI
jgi:hypothetical protein